MVQNEYFEWSYLTIIFLTKNRVRERGKQQGLPPAQFQLKFHEVVAKILQRGVTALSACNIIIMCKGIYLLFILINKYGTIHVNRISAATNIWSNTKICLRVEIKAYIKSFQKPCTVLKKSMWRLQYVACKVHTKRERAFYASRKCKLCH